MIASLMTRDIWKRRKTKKKRQQKIEMQKFPKNLTLET